MKLTLNDYISIFIHQTDLLLTNYIKNKLVPHNLAPEQNLIMMVLWEQDGITQNNIAKKLGKDKTNIARMVYNLEQKGFIQRVNDEKDKRISIVYLTESGKKLANRIIPITEEFNELVCKGITNEELLEVKRILIKMRANVEW